MEWDATAGAGNGWFLSVQFHPERLAPTLAEHARLFEGFIAACHAGMTERISSPTP
jgi:gamma-glutamyl-gamma-aminobutyrate hydrolase PuuD